MRKSQSFSVLIAFFKIEYPAIVDALAFLKRFEIILKRFKKFRNTCTKSQFPSAFLINSKLRSALTGGLFNVKQPENER